MSEAVAVMAQMPSTKKELDKYFQIIKDEVLDGGVDIIKVSQQMNVLKKLVAEYEADDEIQSALLNEAEKYVKADLPKYMQVKEVGTKYDFSEWDTKHTTVY